MLPFGQTVLLWRLHRGLTQGALAQAARIPRPNLSAMERGAREVSLRTIRALALALNIPAGILVDGVPPSLSAGQKPWTREELERVTKSLLTHHAMTRKRERTLAMLLASLVRTRRPPLDKRIGRKAERA